MDPVSLGNANTPSCLTRQCFLGVEVTMLSDSSVGQRKENKI